MSRSLTWKLTLAFLLVAATAAMLVGLFLRLTNADQLRRLVVEQQRGEFQQVLAAYYQANGSWNGVMPYLTGLGWKPPPEGPGRGSRPPPPGQRRDIFAVVDAQGVVVVPFPPQFPPGQRLPPSVIAEGEPVRVGDAVVGVILTRPDPPGLLPEETAYLQRLNLALLGASLAAVAIALVVGVGLARTLTRPLRALTQAAHKMAAGDMTQQVHYAEDDELGELAEAFNQMSRDLARAHHLRRQMTADIAHDLRTPLTVIAGYIEAMRDGVLRPTPDRLGLIYAEIERLQHLIGDLRLLSQADAGELPLHRQPFAPRLLLDRVAAPFLDRAAHQGVALHVEAADDLPAVAVDESRMAQVFGNLISNALRYTPAGGEIVLSAVGEAEGVRLVVRDTGTGIAAEDLPHIFDRFYRGDKARQTTDSESGLGLAIARALVEAHGGRIHAEAAPGQGTSLIIRLPADHRVLSGR